MSTIVYHYLPNMSPRKIETLDIFSTRFTFYLRIHIQNIQGTGTQRHTENDRWYYAP